jgi:hypothetical protein
MVFDGRAIRLWWSIVEYMCELEAKKNMRNVLGS